MNLLKTLFFPALLVLGALFLSYVANANDTATEAQLLEMFDEGQEIISEFDRFSAHEIEKAPRPFEDSNIKRKLKDGSTQEFDGNKYKIVRRTHSHKKPTPAKKEEISCGCEVREKCCKGIKEPHRNRVSLLAGYGALGNIDETVENGIPRFETEQGLVMGLQYMRDLHVDEDMSFHLGVQGQTNKTLSIMGGVGF